MASLNKCMLIGNLGKDPEIKMTPSGQKVATFSIASSEKYTDKSGQKVEKTEWHNIVAWKKLAEIIESYVKKGSTVYIEGKLTTRSWEDSNGGGKKYRTEVLVSQLQMLSSKRDQQGQSQGGQQQGQGQDIPEDSEDLPF